MQWQTLSKSEWTVHVLFWTWIYTINDNGTVSYRNPQDGKTGSGTWKKEGNRISFKWKGSDTVEHWNLPITLPNAEGTAKIDGQVRVLSAKMNNYIQLDDIYIYTRTPQQKADFIARCDQALHQIGIAETNYQAWHAGMTAAYNEAFESFKKFQDDLIQTRRVIIDVMFGLSLAFIGGGLGSAVSKRAAVSINTAFGEKTYTADFLIDGIKDLTKFTVRESARSLLQTPGTRNGSPSPLTWSSLLKSRALREFVIIRTALASWRMCVLEDDDTFDASFDPLIELTTRMKLGGIDLLAFAEPDWTEVQRTLEQSWFEGWIANNKGAVADRDVLGMTKSGMGKDYGQKIGFPNLEARWSRDFPVFSAPVRVTPF